MGTRQSPRPIGAAVCTVPDAGQNVWDAVAAAEVVVAGRARLAVRPDRLQDRYGDRTPIRFCARPSSCCCSPPYTDGDGGGDGGDDRRNT